MSHSLISQMPSFLGGALPPCGISLGQSNHPTLWPCQGVSCLGQGVEGWQTQGVSVAKLCGFGVGAIPVNLTGASPSWDICQNHPLGFQQTYPPGSR